MTENQKKILFCIEALRNRDKRLMESTASDITAKISPYAENLLYYFMKEIDNLEFYELLKDRTGVKADL